LTLIADEKQHNLTHSQFGASKFAPYPVS